MSRPARRWKYGPGPQWQLPKHLTGLLPAEQRVLAGMLASHRTIPYPRLNYYLECLCPNGRYRPGRDLLNMLVKDRQVTPEEAHSLRNQVQSTCRPVRLGPYELLAKIGEGGMGGVYAAIDTRTGKRFAVKVLRKSLAKKKHFLKRFFREAQAALSLRHENIIAGVDVGETDGFHFFVMEYVEGKDCDELVRVNGPFEPYEALRIVREVAKALRYAHRKGFVHRDVKPANIVVSSDGKAKLADFGLVKDLSNDSRLTQAGVAMGTPHFISPEQATNSGKVDRRSDIYCLGATLYFLLTGQPPFDGRTPTEIAGKQVHSKPRRIRRLAPGTPKVIERMVEAMMAKAPQDRYQSASYILADIDAVLSGDEPRRMPRAPRLPARSAYSQDPLRAMLTGAVLGSALVLSAVIGYFMYLDERLPGLVASLRRLGTAVAQTILPFLNP